MADRFFVRYQPGSGVWLVMDRAPEDLSIPAPTVVHVHDTRVAAQADCARMERADRTRQTHR